MEGTEDVAFAAAEVAAATERAGGLAFRLVPEESGQTMSVPDPEALEEFEAASAVARQTRRTFRTAVMMAIRADGQQPEEMAARLRFQSR
jgi:hypothetical protein